MHPHIKLISALIDWKLKNAHGALQVGPSTVLLDDICSYCTCML